MSKNRTEIPYTEIVERVKKLSRAADNTEEKIRGLIQDVYTRELPVKHDWNFLFASSSITTVAEYHDGTVTATTGNSFVQFTNASITSAMNGRKLKINGADGIYDITFVNTTTMTVVPSFQSNQNVANVSFSIFQPIYTLPSDFDRFPKNGGIFKWSGGEKKVLSEVAYQNYTSDYTPNAAEPDKVRLIWQDTAGNQLVEFCPPPRIALNYGVDYIRELSPLSDTTAGYIQGISAGATSVVGLSSTRFLEAQSGDYLRIDALGVGQDSSWYPILSIANNQTLTLAVAFANTAITSSANYTIARAPEMPTKLHPAVLFGALRGMTLDQTDENAVVYNSKFAEVMSDGKRLYVSRIYNEQVHTIAEDWNYRR